MKILVLSCDTPWQPQGWVILRYLQNFATIVKLNAQSHMHKYGLLPESATVIAVHSTTLVM